MYVLASEGTSWWGPKRGSAQGWEGAYLDLSLVVFFAKAAITAFTGDSESARECITPKSNDVGSNAIPPLIAWCVYDGGELQGGQDGNVGP